MDLLALDKDFMPVEYLEYTNLQWNRKYYECGDFSIRVSEKSYSGNMMYIYCPTRIETGIIQKVEYEQTPTGDFVQLSGFFLERILNDKIAYPTYYASGNLEDATRNMVETYKEDIPLLRLGNKNNLGSNVTWQETGGEIGDTLYSRLSTQQLSQRCRYDYNDNVIYYEVWQGADRTQDQFVNNPVTFSTGFKNIQDALVTTDSSNYKNFFVVAGSGEGSDRIVENVDLSGGGYKKKLFVNASSEKYDPEKQTMEQYRESLRAKGEEKALDYLDISNVEVSAQDSGFAYMEDYDLGDLCDIEIEGLNLHLSARIIEINEVVKENVHRITLTFGDKFITNTMKARL